MEVREFLDEWKRRQRVMTNHMDFGALLMATKDEETIEREIKELEEWSKANPRRTRLDVLRDSLIKNFPQLRLDQIKTTDTVCDLVNCRIMDYMDEEITCEECMAYWLAEVEE